GVVIIRLPVANKVVIKKHAGLRVPQIFVDGGLAGLRALTPFLCLRRTPQQSRKSLHVSLGFVQQAIQTNRSKMMSRTTKWAEAEGNIKSGFAHGPVAFVEILR